MLDALIGNSDRHDENWALISSPVGVEHAPTFDHASSLGRNESDAKRLERLTTKDTSNNVEAYARRARSALYQASKSTKPLSPLDAFAQASTYAPIGKAYWLQKLSELNSESVNEILDKIPDHIITDPARKFALAMITFNKDQLVRMADKSS